MSRILLDDENINGKYCTLNYKRKFENSSFKMCVLVLPYNLNKLTKRNAICNKTSFAECCNA